MKDFRLGVLFVHGIGTQAPRDTLVRWGDVLLIVIGRATKNQAKEREVVLSVGRASAGDRSGDKPAEVAVDIRCGDRTERWLLAEGWWADCFPAPTYSELVSWSVRAMPLSIALHIAQNYWQAKAKAVEQAKAKAKAKGEDEAKARASRRAMFWAWAKAVAPLLGALILSPVLIAVLALVLLLGLLPIPQLRTMILSAQTTLIGTVGDSLAFVESPLRAALIVAGFSKGSSD